MKEVKSTYAVFWSKKQQTKSCFFLTTNYQPCCNLRKYCTCRPSTFLNLKFYTMNLWILCY